MQDLLWVSRLSWSAPLISYCVVALILIITILAAKSSWDRSRRKTNLVKQCAQEPVLHVLFESELGHHNDIAQMLAELMDQSECPTRLQVHILEPVSSIKAIDLLHPALVRASEGLPRYATFFKDHVHILKVHQSRKLVGPKAMQHLLSSLGDVLAPTDAVMWMPHMSKVEERWDAFVRKDFASIGLKSLLVFPLCASQPSVTSRQSAGHFFAMDDSLRFSTKPMSRSAITPSIGLSFAHPFAGCAQTVRQLVDACVELEVEEDLSISFLATSLGFNFYHGSSALACKDLRRRLTNRRAELASLFRLFAMFDEPSVRDWLETEALSMTVDQDDIVIFGRGYMGMSRESSMQEILVKWGSQEAFETEREALKYG